MGSGPRPLLEIFAIMSFMEKELSSFKNLCSTQSDVQGGVFALGNFDGVHRGHQAVIQATLTQAQKHNALAYVLTLEPHPRQILTSKLSPFRLTPAPHKIGLLKSLGVHEVITLTFSPELRRVSAEDFVSRLLVEKYRARHVVAGYDFVFGYQRRGNLKLLQTLLSPHGIGITGVPPQYDEKGEIISSSRARTALQEGDPILAKQILGRPWSIRGVVTQGNKRGKILGFPTANIELDDYLRPLFGVYAVLAGPIGSTSHLPGVANVGTRPTVGGGRERLELHMFDDHGDLYGQEWEVELHHFIRAEQAFPDIKALQEQIAKDIERAKELLALGR